MDSNCTRRGSGWKLGEIMNRKKKKICNLQVTWTHLAAEVGHKPGQHTYLALGFYGLSLSLIPSQQLIRYVLGKPVAMLQTSKQLKRRIQYCNLYYPSLIAFPPQRCCVSLSSLRSSKYTSDVTRITQPLAALQCVWQASIPQESKSSSLRLVLFLTLLGQQKASCDLTDNWRRELITLKKDPDLFP